MQSGWSQRALIWSRDEACTRPQRAWLSGLIPVPAERVRAVTGFSIGGDVFGIETEALIRAIPDARVLDVS